MTKIIIISLSCITSTVTFYQSSALNHVYIIKGKYLGRSCMWSDCLTSWCPLIVTQTTKYCHHHHHHNYYQHRHYHHHHHQTLTIIEIIIININIIIVINMITIIIITLESTHHHLLVSSLC